MIVRGTEFISFGLQTIGAPVMRVGQRMYLQEQKSKLQKLLTRSAQGMFLIGFPITLFLIFGGRFYLLVFGKQFLTAYPALVLLSFAELINLMTGNAGLLLNRTGHENLAARVLGMSVLVNIVLGVILIPSYGLLGAAIADGFATILRNIILSIVVHRKMGLNTTPIPVKRISSQ